MSGHHASEGPPANMSNWLFENGLYSSLGTSGLEMKARVEERVFNVLVERDEDGYYVASVVELPGCHTQAKTLDQLTRRIRKAVEAYLQVAKPERGPEFVGMQQLKIISSY